MKCTSRKRDGSRCRANSVSGSDRCFLHSKPGAAATIGREGGRRRKIFDPTKLTRFARPKTAGELFVIAAETLVDVRQGRVDAKVGNAVAQLAMTCQSLLKVCDLEMRIARLEEKDGRRSSSAR
jgi:hypothetical protein